MKGSWRDFFELLRLPAVFTAIADVLMGYLVTQGSLQPPWAIALLVLASSSIYLAGMVLNDVFDAEVDAMERPQRPIPSGRISLAAAQQLGCGLLSAGVMAACATAMLTHTWRPAIVGILLAACVVLYDRVLKRTPLAPLVMGSCRLLNVLLGMSLAETTDTFLPRPWTAAEWLIAAGIGIYITGVTVFARTEARISSRWRLFGGMVTMFVGAAIVVLATTIDWQAQNVFAKHSVAFWLLFGCGAPLMITSFCIFAIIRPDPRIIQFGVIRALRGLLMIDFIVALSFSGSGWALLIAFLIVPMSLLERRFSTT